MVNVNAELIAPNWKKWTKNEQREYVYSIKLHSTLDVYIILTQ